ncbi:MAG: hypothetical protein P3X23_008585 [Thermosynechococcus sp. Uc]|uniref:hypothetical protein n=1 Tax=Thermosynechococcus sp. Uc TaxID=3034853 RepID=UPI0019E545E7|nr:hypothetical protein [Thermosynechococcus sp. Uc]MDM7327152.1 hypothetical protein [Thermosynechococcus sp. Uc]HIK25682.1 hypothetical protein [Thermosynechococcus sp. M46_R2017_013]
MQVIRYIRYLDSDRSTVGQIPPPTTAVIQPCARRCHRPKGTKTALKQDDIISEKGGILESISYSGSEGLQR